MHLEAKPTSKFEKATAELKKQQCSYCHQTDTAGQYMEPVSYEKHCQQCHPLSIRVTGNWEDEKLKKAEKEFNDEPAPHRKPKVVRGALWERFAQFLEDHPAVLPALEGFKPSRPVPGTEQHEKYLKIKETWIESQRQQAERVLFADSGTCSYCHEVSKKRVKDELPEYKLTQVMARWFSHSQFSHVRHQMLKCTECHSGAPESRDKSEVLMPGIADCRKCHLGRGGARSDCIECHKYHPHTLEPFQGKFTISEATRNP
jgi:hypothetical protein